MIFLNLRNPLLRKHRLILPALRAWFPFSTPCLALWTHPSCGLLVKWVFSVALLKVLQDLLFHGCWLLIGQAGCRRLRRHLDEKLIKVEIVL